MSAPCEQTDAPSGALRVGEPLLQCEGLVIGYRGDGLLPALDLTIQRGTFLLVVGRNGAGKSTWLKTLLGLIPPVRGRLRKILPALEMSYVPQAAGIDELLPVSAETVVDWGQLRGFDFLRPFRSRDERRIRERAVAEANAQTFIHQPFRDLSGGQRQRVLFARLLASRADIAVLDEPTAAMDMASERQAYEQMAHLTRSHGMTVIVVTHTISTAAEHADQVLFLDRGEQPGRGVVALGTPHEIFSHPLFRRHFGTALGTALDTSSNSARATAGDIEESMHEQPHVE